MRAGGPPSRLGRRGSDTLRSHHVARNVVRINKLAFLEGSKSQKEKKKSEINTITEEGKERKGEEERFGTQERMLNPSCFPVGAALRRARWRLQR